MLTTTSKNDIIPEISIEDISHCPNLHLVKKITKVEDLTRSNINNVIENNWAVVPMTYKWVLRRERKREWEIRKIRKEISRITGFNFISYNGKINWQGWSLWVHSFIFENKNWDQIEIQADNNN